MLQVLPWRFIILMRRNILFEKHHQLFLSQNIWVVAQSTTGALMLFVCILFCLPTHVPELSVWVCNVTKMSCKPRPLQATAPYMWMCDYSYSASRAHICILIKIMLLPWTSSINVSEYLQVCQWWKALLAIHSQFLYRLLRSAVLWGIVSVLYDWKGETKCVI